MTGEGALPLRRVQLPGRRAVGAGELANARALVGQGSSLSTPGGAAIRAAAARAVVAVAMRGRRLEDAIAAASAGRRAAAGDAVDRLRHRALVLRARRLPRGLLDRPGGEAGPGDCAR